MFCDVVTIKLIAGKGGDGHASFLHEKYREKGGPDGGDGGKGGSIYLIGERNLNTLYDYKTKRKISAENGETGKTRNKRGASAEDLYLRVPLGTQIFDGETDELIGDVKEEGQSVLLVLGGDGGYGNAHFASSVRQTPKAAELGERGEEKIVRLEMKLIADVGLVGLPNVGKSTLLSVISDAKPKIADYHFTTLVPNLGVVSGDRFGLEDVSFVVADIPGLIEGAAEGKGLGDDFLKHIERTRVIIHLIDATTEDPIKDFEAINKELQAFSEDLTQKIQVVVLTKSDIGENAEEKAKVIGKMLKKVKIPPVANTAPLVISSPTHQGLREMISAVWKVIEAENKKVIPEEKVDDYKTFTIEDVVRDVFSVEMDGEVFVVKGRKIERFARRTDFSNQFSVYRLRNIMARTGISSELKKKGADSSSDIRIGEKTFKINF